MPQARVSNDTQAPLPVRCVTCIPCVYPTGKGASLVQYYVWLYHCSGNPARSNSQCTHRPQVDTRAPDLARFFCCFAHFSASHT